MPDADSTTAKNSNAVPFYCFQNWPKNGPKSPHIAKIKFTDIWQHGVGLFWPILKAVKRNSIVILTVGGIRGEEGTALGTAAPCHPSGAVINRFCRAAYAVMQCPSIRPSGCHVRSKRVIVSSKFFSPYWRTILI